MGALIWLASYPKSGNTWLRSFLCNLLIDAPEPADINKLANSCDFAEDDELLSPV